MCQILGEFGTNQIHLINLFFYKLELKQFPDTMSRSIIFENQEQMQCVNFGSDDFFPSARNELDTCSLNQKISNKNNLAVKIFGFQGVFLASNLRGQNQLCLCYHARHLQQIY